MSEVQPPRRPSLLKVVQPPAPALPGRLELIRSQLLAWDDAQARQALGAPAEARLLKTTVSLCPQCLEHVPALVATDGRAVHMYKHCPVHGHSAAVVENDVAYFHLSNRDRWGRHYGLAQPHVIPAYASLAGECCADGSSCGTDAATDQHATKSCTVLMEVTDACNLSCPVCYADAKGNRVLPVEAFTRLLDKLVAHKGVIDSIQLTGGEATLHPHFWDLVEAVFRQPGVQRLYLPTNGIFFLKPHNIERLVQYKDKAMVLLQFDGMTDATDARLRDAALARVRSEVLDALTAADVAVQLTMTVSADVNLHEVGAVVAEGMRRRNVRLVALQPVTYSGRYLLAPDPMRRLTLSDLAKEVQRQAGLRMRDGDFVPIPCSHPQCGWISLFYRRFGITENVMKYIDAHKVLDDVASKTVLKAEELSATMGTGQQGLAARVLKALVRPKDIFSVAIKPFMDRFTYDQDRISSCCHHTTDTRGNLVSFCEYNARMRHADDWSALPTLPA